MAECKISDCHSPTVNSRGWCKAHYLRWWRHGDPLAGGTKQGEPECFYRDVVLTYDGDECLLWPFARTQGYGTVHLNGKQEYVSRLVCKETHGPPPTPRHEAAHSCGKGDDGCVTKGHLSWKTRPGNIADKMDHGTHQFGEQNSSAKLTEENVREILALSQKRTPQRKIAKAFGVSHSTISDIIHRRTWSWMHDDAKIAKLKGACGA